jgi:hypothetical protein
MTKAIGLDYHGVITANPNLFSVLTKILRSLNYEVHIITGSRITEQLKEQLAAYGIAYTHLFSISDYHHQHGTAMTGYAEYQPKIANEIWDKTKALYCREHKIDAHIDDSDVYGQHFTTPYILFKGGEKPSIVIQQTEGEIQRMIIDLYLAERM